MSHNIIPKILLVDDKKENLISLSALLKQVDAEIHMTNNGSEALNMSLKHEFALIILDVQMPEMDGFEVAQFLKLYESTKNIPIIFLTAISKDEQNILKGYENGAVDYLCKPVHNNILLSKVQKFLDIYVAEKSKLDEIKSKYEHIKAKHQGKKEIVDFEKNYDNLTMISNRFAFEDLAQREIAMSQRHKSKFVFIIFDVDNFKWVNKKFSHTAGDFILQNIAVRIQNCIRKNDILARVGGDSFAVIATGLKNEEDSAVIIEKILDNLSNSYKINSTEIKLTFSAGASFFPSSGNSTKELFEKAESALEKAQLMNDNSFVFADEAIDIKYSRQRKIQEQLEKANITKEFRVVYQPIVKLKTGEIVGAEALMRWNNKELGEISPTEFIPVAEKNGYISDIGFFCLNSVCETIKFAEKNNLKKIFFSLNISSEQFKDSNFNKNFQNILKFYNVKAEQVDLEINESALNICLSGRSSEYLDFLNMSKDFNITIDDFGTSYSSIEKLISIPVKTLKIDGCFIDKVQNDSHSAQIVKSIICLSKSLNINVIAECVENEQQVKFLLECGCVLGQGFYFYEPVEPKILLEKYLISKN